MKIFFLQMNKISNIPHSSADDVIQCMQEKTHMMKLRDWLKMGH